MYVNVGIKDYVTWVVSEAGTLLHHNSTFFLQVPDYQQKEKKKTTKNPKRFSASCQYSVQIFEKRKVISCESVHLFWKVSQKILVD